jgi:Holliday junction DNA helicase RuvB
VGATTQVGRLSNPLRDRFGIQFNLDFYSLEDMKKILARSAQIMSIKMSTADIDAVARRSRGTPRITNRLLARVRDFTDIADDKISSQELSERALKTFSNSSKSSRVVQALEFLDVDHRGLQPLDRQYLMTLIKHYKGGPAGVDALAASLSEDRSTLEETVEPFLLKEGFIVRTPKGRMVTDLSYEHLGLTPIVRVPDAAIF